MGRSNVRPDGEMIFEGVEAIFSNNEFIIDGNFVGNFPELFDFNGVPDFALGVIPAILCLFFAIYRFCQGSTQDAIQGQGE